MVRRAQLIALNACSRKEERSRYSHLCVHRRKVGKKQIKSKVGRRKEIRIRTEINEIKTKKISREKNNKTKAGSLKRSIKSTSL